MMWLTGSTRETEEEKPNDGFVYRLKWSFVYSFQDTEYLIGRAILNPEHESDNRNAYSYVRPYDVDDDISFNNISSFSYSYK